LGFNPTVSPPVQEFILAIITYLLVAFLITVAVDLFFIVIILISEAVLGLILGRRIQ
jgi:hypothetical protein